VTELARVRRAEFAVAAFGVTALTPAWLGWRRAALFLEPR
jgi:hypothetical protein